MKGCQDFNPDYNGGGGHIPMQLYMYNLYELSHS